MIIERMMRLLASNKVIPEDRYTGACTSGVPDSTAFHSNRSDGYAFRCKATLSNTRDIQSSGISTQQPG